MMMTFNTRALAHLVFGLLLTLLALLGIVVLVL